MQIPFLDLKAQYNSIKEEVNPAIQNVLDNTAYVLGKPVADFENNFALKHGVKHCIGTSSGTDANHLVLWALGIGRDDEVIMPANTFIATAWGATLCGAKPVFVDCDADNYNINPELIEKAITKKTKAIVAVHLYGQPADMDAIKEIGMKYNVAVVEDAAQAHNAEYKDSKVGGLSIASSFSFYPGKNLGAYGEAGAVLTNDDQVARKVRQMRDHGAVEKYNHEVLGHNYRMEGIQGAVLDIKLKYLDEWTAKRREVASLYNKLLPGSGLVLPFESAYAKHVFHLYVVQVKNGDINKRNDLKEYLTEKGIATGLHYPIPLHLQKCFHELGYKEGDFPESEKLAKAGLSLPIFPEMTIDQVTYVSDMISAYFS